MSKKKKKKSEVDEVQPVVVNRSPGFSSQFKEDLARWCKQDFHKASKILDLVTAVMQDPFEGIGKPEPLKYLDADIWSRRIDLEHRLVYRVGNTQIDFLACRYHTNLRS
ncbi:MAG: Txe/YoeB family addiction module toxin [Fischerella sp.]|uniref:Txe/YoeB family addiction module toxin n=1 Tax=Fischerella sp. TaxID=1191 RepID=UPI00179F9064|nr:Txe/YoeB family addiction module toxin [Fischerella sp.]NWF61212.1 Txe/YoeB family addiction module toxin [Fischerella sp.]